MPDPTTGLELAIIGMSARLPGAPTLAAFWQNLCDGVESVAFFSEQELKASGVAPALLHDPHYVRARAIIDDIELFDAAFFGFTPREAELTDPQKRLFLEVAWEALEHAGYTTETFPLPVGIYAGLGTNSYLFNNLYANLEHLLEWGGTSQIIIGNDKDYLTTLAAYKLHLVGPAVTVQTACSTSLVAVHLACQSLLNGECDLALAGGVSVGVPQKIGYLYQESGIMSPDGHCRAFDAQAHGAVGGQGAGVIVLKRLADALADGDSICAVIKGSAINNDGTAKIGYTAPGVEGQTKVIRAAQLMAEVEVETISYVEAHGTATALGDPIEVTALTQAFRAGTDEQGFCALGSVKTNIGHLDAASGIAGLIKTVLALQHRQMPPSLHFERPNPAIDFAASPFYVNASLAEWRTDDGPRRAGVSSFGIGGTNAHVILEEAPPAVESDPARPWQLLVLSARTPTALERATDRLLEHIQSYPAQPLADIAYTLQVGRKLFEHRRIVVCADRDDAARILAARDPQRMQTQSDELRARPIVFVCGGLGDHYVGMGWELYQTERYFREQVDHCARLLVPHLGLDVRDVLYPDRHLVATETPPAWARAQAGESLLRRLLARDQPPSADAATQQLQQTTLAQPAVFVITFALAQLWMRWGIQPEMLIGHSLGEYVAACLAGVLDLEDALFLVVQRAQLIEQAPEGAMLAVALSEAEVRPLLGPQLSLAAVNSPAACVIAGPLDAIAALEQQLSAHGHAARRLPTTHAFHSAILEPLADQFAQLVAGVSLHPPRIPYMSNVTGALISAAEATDPAYWARHLCETVRFSDGLQALLEDPDYILLEIGPGRSLSLLAKQHPDGVPDRLVLASMRHQHDKHTDAEFLLNTLGQLWLAGIRPRWAKFYDAERRQRVPLPTYPFERKRYWMEPPDRTRERTGQRGRAGRLPAPNDWSYVPSWKRSAPPDLASAPPPPDDAGGWLIFLDAVGLGELVLAHLEQRGQPVVGILAGDAFARVAPGRYRLRPSSREDYGALLDDLRSAGPLPQTVLHLWALAAPHADDLAAAEQEFYSLLYMAQALGETDDRARQFVICSNQLQAVTGDETLVPAYATLLGPCLVLPQEYAQLTCRAIDFALPPGDSLPLAQLRDQLIAEVLSGAPERVVAYRGRYRWIQTIAPQPLAPAAHPHPRLRTHGVYLITGGLSVKGLTFAAYLATAVRARLILISRAPVPPREHWEAWLAQAEAHDSLAQALRAVRDLEAVSAEVLVISADVTDEAQMRAAIAQAEARFGTLNGVIHAAEHLDAGPAQLKTTQAAAAVLAPKLQGTLVLARILHQRELDFLVLCSSLTALLGGAGQIDACAANAFLDAFAQQTRDAGRFTVSINWDTWSGGAASLDGDGAELQPTPASGLLPREGVELLARILSMRHPLPQVLVSVSDLFDRIADAHALPQAQATPTPAHPSADTRPTPERASAYVAPTTETEQVLAQLWCRVIGLEQVGIHDNFFDLGGHSLMALQILGQLRALFQMDLSLPDLFETPTIAGLAEAIETLRWTTRRGASAKTAPGDDREEGEL
jgi:acyl transferase domain-containing protein/acyl carrier protein